MKKFIKLAIGMITVISIIAVSLSSGLLATAEEAGMEIQVWKRGDIVLNSEKSYGNPYLDVEITAVFTHVETGKEISLAGFWNGGDEWRVRFSPTETGVWSYKITSNTSDPGFEKTGSITAVPNTGDTELDKHGFIKFSDNNRYFTYDDGTPFYWLGDTNWQAPNYVSVNSCNYPGCDCGNQFKHEADNRLAKGFTVYQTYFDSGEGDGGGQIGHTDEPSLWLDKTDYSLINPETFSEKVDYMFDYLADHGMVIALGMGVHASTPNSMGEHLLEITRYITARYASYPIVWITGQEIDMSLDIWKRSAEVTDRLDGYNHPQGTHLLPNTANAAAEQDLNKQPWHEWWAVQGGHCVVRTKEHYKSYWDTGKLFLETEANYEDINCGGFTGYNYNRYSAWKANLCGSYGFTYGADGIWANCYSTAGNAGWLGSFSYEPWYMGLDKPGSFEMSYLKRFFEYAGYYNLIPRFSDSAYSDFDSETKVVASSEGGETYAAYFYNSNRTTGRLYGLDETKVYTARWYNPLTGKFVQIADNIVPAGGEYKIPDKLTAGDWALLVTCLDLGEYETEEPYSDPLITESSNLALNAAASSSSYSMDGFTADKAVDGQSNTYWCASSGSFPQWLTVDLGEVREFDRIVMDMVPKTPACTYTVQASDDGESWSSIYSGESETPVTAAGCARFMIAAGGKYRYIRVEFTDIPGDNWAAVNELSVYLGQPEITGDTNLVLGAASKDSSHNSYEGIYTSAASVDGNRETYWCADGGAFPQWVKYDLGQTTDFNEISMAIHDYAAKYSFGIYGTNDAGLWDTTGTDGWEEICSCDGEQPDGGRFDFQTEGESYRYLQVYFTGISDGHWAAIHEFEVYNRSEDETALPEFGGEKQEFDVYCTGSGVYTAEGDYSNTDVYLNDGDIATEWNPFAPLCTQTVMIELSEVRRLGGIYITLGERAFLPQYRIYGSSDGENWTVLTDTTLRPAKSVKFSGRTVVCEELSGDWRYLKLLWLSGQDNAAVKSIAEIELYAEELPKPPVDPDDPDDPDEPKYKLGDVDKNGTVNVSDIMTLKNLIMTGSWSDEQLRLGDMDKSNTLNVSDMLSIKNLIMAGG